MPIISEAGLSSFFVVFFFQNRQQYVSTNNVNSSISSIGMGVRQGSNLVPLLFLVLIGDIVSLAAY